MIIEHCLRANVTRSNVGNPWVATRPRATPQTPAARRPWDGHDGHCLPRPRVSQDLATRYGRSSSIIPPEKPKRCPATPCQQFSQRAEECLFSFQCGADCNDRRRSHACRHNLRLTLHLIQGAFRHHRGRPRQDCSQGHEPEHPRSDHAGDRRGRAAPFRAARRSTAPDDQRGMTRPIR